MAVGYPVRLRVIQAVGDESYSHIYLMVGIINGSDTEWRPLDPTEDHGPFWEVDGAQKCLDTGKPAGLVMKARDFDVI